MTTPASAVDTSEKRDAWLEEVIGCTDYVSVSCGSQAGLAALPLLRVLRAAKAVNAARSAANSADDLARLTASQQRSLRSLQGQVGKHQTKLDAYRANPDAYDNLGILERAPTSEIRQRIIDGRIRYLETEIRTFQDQIDKLLGGG